MQVNLKKANDYAEACAAAAKAIKISPSLNISIYSTDDIATRLANHATLVAQQVADVASLIETQYAIRHQIGRQNDEHGINPLLTERAKITALEARLSSVLKAVDVPGEDVESIETVKAKMEGLKARALAQGYGEERLSIQAGGAELAEKLRRDNLVLHRRKEENLDEVTAINLSHTITLHAEQLAVLRKFEIVA